MRISCYLAIFVLATSALSNCNAQTVVLNDNIFIKKLEVPVPPTTHEIDLGQNPSNTDGTSAFLSLNESGLLTLEDTAVDEGSDWYVVSAGETLSLETTTAGANTPWTSFSLDIPTSPPLVPSLAETTFYLGFATQLGGDDFTVADRTVFGWAEVDLINFDSNNPSPDLADLDLFITASAIAYDSSGIIVGTNTSFAAIPEPNCAVAVFFLGLVTTYQRRRG